MLGCRAPWVHGRGVLDDNHGFTYRGCLEKRFNLTKTGKVKRAKAFKSHILTKKDAKRKMRLGQGALVDATNVKAVRRMMPYA